MKCRMQSAGTAFYAFAESVGNTQLQFHHACKNSQAWMLLFAVANLSSYRLSFEGHVFGGLITRANTPNL